jgi:hypothetical protein
MKKRLFSTSQPYFRKTEPFCRLVSNVLVKRKCISAMHPPVGLNPSVATGGTKHASACDLARHH